MYAIYAYIGVVLGVNVGIYGIHGVSGICQSRGMSGIKNGWFVEYPSVTFAH